MMVTCKKWHVAKRLVERVRAVTNLPAIDYLFNEAARRLPDLGGIQSNLEKRTRHRRALVRMLFDYWQTDRLIFCIDPASTELMQDFYNDRAKVRLLEIDCDFTDDYLVGHARAGRVWRATARRRKPSTGCCRRSAMTCALKATISASSTFPAFTGSGNRRRWMKTPCRWPSFLIFPWKRRARLRRPNTCLWIETIDALDL